MKVWFPSMTKWRGGSGSITSLVEVGTGTNLSFISSKWYSDAMSRVKGHRSRRLIVQLVVLRRRGLVCLRGGLKSTYLNQRVNHQILVLDTMLAEKSWRLMPSFLLGYSNCVRWYWRVMPNRAFGDHILVQIYIRARLFYSRMERGKTNGQYWSST